MRISLKELLVVVAFVAFIAWCAGEIGYASAMFWIVAGASLAMSAIFVAGGSSQSGRGLACLALVVPFACLFLMIYSPVLMVYGFVLFVAGLVLLCLPPLRKRTLCFIAMGAAVASFAYGVLAKTNYQLALEDLRRDYPIVLLAKRTEYEHDGAKADATPVELTPAVSAELGDFEDYLESEGGRRWRLDLIHDRQYEQFVRATGFGVTRMVAPSRYAVEMPPLRNIAFDEVPRSLDDRDEWAHWQGKRWLPAYGRFDGLHASSRNDFLDPEGFGAVLRPKEAVGFVEHGMHATPVEGLENAAAWQIDRLELVSLLRFDEPRVYVLDHLPRMDQLSGVDVPTRELDEFEAGALERIQKDEDVVVEEREGAYRMLGSLRAAKQCMDCHDVPRGELLGAFTYQLQFTHIPGVTKAVDVLPGQSISAPSN